MWTFLSILLAIAALLALYVLVIRPFLRSLPALQELYAEADTFWSKAWALCWNSLTVLWAYVLSLVGTLMSQLDSIAALLGDPGLQANISAMLGANTRLIGGVMIAIAVITFLARLRSMAG